MPSHIQNQIAPNGVINPSKVVVVMVPLPWQGHLHQFISLSHLITARAIPVHFVGAATENNQGKLRIHGGINTTNEKMIHFHDFVVPPCITTPPSPTSAHNFPIHLIPTFHATRHLGEPVAALLRQLSSEFRRVVVVHDFLTSSLVHGIGPIPNVESYALQGVSAFAISLLHSRDRDEKSELDQLDIADLIIPEDVPSMEGCVPPEIMELSFRECTFVKLSSGNLYNTSMAIERPYVNLMARILPNKKHWAIGPLNMVTLSEKKVSNGRHMCLEWLDKQAPRSVIYVSFGTTTTFTDEQIGELALGLEQSGQKFIWVLRDAEKATRKVELPKGFEERAKDVGIVMRDLAPQLEILGHPSTGGFLSHCGWNSCIESIAMGVPIGAWPMHSDQPRNTSLITQVLKVGTAVRDWSRRFELATASTIADGVRKLMASTEGNAMRKKAAELGAALRDSLAEGGDSHKEFDSFVAHITR
ncbi:zeatin O-glucosyltransferase [Morus notabilis]|uniref:zeatin O-glucosyltransferase n=1 Tax=Morus notabilis TaxID=981085 RepID=UPI000CED5E38|nr:zeatin O-glucosyltransferase [Morus notabilis]